MRGIFKLAHAGLFAGVALVLGAPSVAASSAAEVARGDFAAFAAGTGLRLSGHAHMVRTADGKTIVSVHVEGLEPGATYNVHVHDGDCATNASGGGHYMFATAVAGGAGPAGNEIWPGPIVADGGGIGNGRANVDATAGPSAASVVVHRSGPAPNKIACADLG